MRDLFKKIKKYTGIVIGNVKKGCRLVSVPFCRLMQTKPVKTIMKAVRIPFIGYLLLACILNFVLEVLSRHSFSKAFTFIGASPWVFFYNAAIIFVTLSLVMFAKRKVFATVFVCVVWIISAFANYIVLCFRTTPFSAVDVLMIRNVMTMLDKYMTKWQMVLSVIGVILVIALLVYLYIRLPKTKHKRNPFSASAYVCMSLILIVTLTKVAVETQTISDNFGNLAYAYNDYGFAYCFSNSIIDVGISKPRNYSEESVKDVVAELEYDKSDVIFLTKEEAEETQEEEQADIGNKTDLLSKDVQTTENGAESGVEAVEQDSEISSEKTTEKEGDLQEGTTEGNKKENSANQNKNSAEKTDSKEESNYYQNEKATEEFPNIIVIQLESVFDTNYMKSFYPSENPLSTLSKLKSKFSSGLFTVPAVGAGTANTEFEVQTGMSTQFFGAGEYPFKTVMRSTTCDSMAYDLKRQGYATAGFHNNDATFYERHIDYSNLGFDVFTGMEHMYALEYTPRGQQRITNWMI